MKKCLTVQISREALIPCIKACFDAKNYRDCARLLQHAETETQETYFQLSLSWQHDTLIQYLIHYDVLPKEIKTMELQIILEVLQELDMLCFVSHIKNHSAAKSAYMMFLCAMKILEFGKIPLLLELLNSLENEVCRQAKALTIFEIYVRKGIQEASQLAQQFEFELFCHETVCYAINRNNRNFLDLTMKDEKWEPNTKCVLKSSLNMDPPYLGFFDHPKLDQFLAREVVMEQYVNPNIILKRFWAEGAEPIQKIRKVSEISNEYDFGVSGPPANPPPEKSSSSWEPSFQLAQSSPSY